MKRSAAIGMMVMGLISLGVAAGFMVSATPMEHVGRAGLPAAVLEVLAAAAGLGCIVYGIRGLRGSSNGTNEDR